MVGESGSGKTTVALALLGHARRGCPSPAGMWLDGTDLLRLKPARAARAPRRQGRYVPQDPSAALNPALRIGTSCGRCSGCTRGGADPAAADQRGAPGGVAGPDRGDPPPLPASAVRRPAAARRAGHGVRLPASADRPGRADHRPGRVDPAARARHRPQLCSVRGGGGVRQPRPGRGRRAGVRGRGDVRRADHGGRGDRAVRRAACTRIPAGCWPRSRHRGGAEPPTGIEGQQPRPGRRGPGCAFAPRCGWSEQCRQHEPGAPVRSSDRESRRRTVRCCARRS